MTRAEEVQYPSKINGVLVDNLSNDALVKVTLEQRKIYLQCQDKADKENQSFKEFVRACYARPDVSIRKLARACKVSPGRLYQIIWRGESAPTAGERELLAKKEK